jgi:hypothetical protein
MQVSHENFQLQIQEKCGRYYTVVSFCGVIIWEWELAHSEIWGKTMDLKIKPELAHITMNEELKHTYLAFAMKRLRNGNLWLSAEGPKVRTYAYLCMYISCVLWCVCFKPELAHITMNEELKRMPLLRLRWSCWGMGTCGFQRRALWYVNMRICVCVCVLKISTTPVLSLYFRNIHAYTRTHTQASSLELLPLKTGFGNLCNNSIVTMLQEHTYIHTYTHTRRPRL